MGRSTDNGVTFFINRQMLDTEGKRSIHGNIVIHGDRRKFSTGLRISEKIWDAKCNQAKGRSPEAQRINISLIKIREIIENLKTDLLLKDGFISAITVRDAYVELSKTPEKRAKEEAIKKAKEEEERRKIEEERERKELEEIGITLLEYFDTYIDSRRKEVEAGELTHVTYGRYLCTRNRLILFMLEEYGDWAIPIKKVDIFFIKNFQMFMLKNFPCQHNAAMKNIQKLCTIINLAFNMGIIPTNPASLFRIHFEETERDRLDEEELCRLYEYPFASETLSRVRDSYIMACYTGLSYIEATSFEQKDLQKYIDGNQYIIKNRAKTLENFKVLLLDVPAEIINKYKGKLPDGQLFPMISNQNTNRFLKEIAPIVGINKKLTYHTARHTFATTICLTNGVPLETVQKLLGHKSIRKKQIYAKIVDKKLTEDMNMLSERLRDKQRISIAI